MEYAVSAFEIVEDEASVDEPTSKYQAVATRRAHRTANEAKRVEEAEKLRFKGNELFKKGDYVNAADLYFQAVANFHGPKPILMSNLTAAYLKLEAYGAAEGAATLALEYEPQNLKARFRRGIARKETANFEGAMQDFKTILRCDPQLQEARTELAIVKAVLGLCDDADDKSTDEDEEYPGFSDTAWVSYSDSDTPDCKHTGLRGFPCRRYNRGGCGQGAECEYSHAPDDKSVRDELGRNVCTYFLLNNCRFGPIKCVYSHDRSHLPPSGWWNYPQQIEAARKLQPLILDRMPERSFLSDSVFRGHPNCKKYGARKKRLESIAKLEVWHECVLADAQEAAAQAGKSMPTEKNVLLISLEEGYFTEIHQHFLSALEKKVKVVKAVTVQQAFASLDSSHLIAVYATDAGIARTRNKSLVSRLVDYTKSGGTVVAGGQFSNHVRPNEFDEFTETWGLPWTYGSYHRTTFSVNQTSDIVRKNPSLVPSYSMKSLHAANVLPEHAIYKTAENARLKSLVFFPRKIEDNGESPVVQAKLGKGWFGFIGDVNGEDESTKTVLAMLGLLDQPIERFSTPPPPKTPSVVVQDGKIAMPPKSKKRATKKNPLTKTPIETTTAETSDKFLLQDGADRPLTTTPKHQKSVVIIALAQAELFQVVHAAQLTQLEQYADVKISRTDSECLAHLSLPNLAGVYLADESIIQSQHALLLARVVEYAKRGCVVIGGTFPSTAVLDVDFPALFTAFGLPWQVTAYSGDQVVLKSGHPLANTHKLSLPDKLSMKAVYLSSFDQDIVYFRETSGKMEASVLQAKIGEGKQKGRVGYIGDVNAEEGTTEILLSMLGLLPPNKEPPPPDRQKFIIVLSWVASLTTEEEKALVDDLKAQKIEVVHGLSNARMVELLCSSDLAGVLVMDGMICEPSNAFLVFKLVEYSLQGGKVVFGRSFATTTARKDIKPFFSENWGLEWDYVTEGSVGVKKNEKHEMVQSLNAKLPDFFVEGATYLGGITEDIALYSTPHWFQAWNPANQIFTSAFLGKSVGANGGLVGFIGDPRLDGDVRKILYAMLGLL